MLTFTLICLAISSLLQANTIRILLRRVRHLEQMHQHGTTQIGEGIIMAQIDHMRKAWHDATRSDKPVKILGGDE